MVRTPHASPCPLQRREFQKGTGVKVLSFGEDLGEAKCE